MSFAGRYKSLSIIQFGKTEGVPLNVKTVPQWRKKLKMCKYIFANLRKLHPGIRTRELSLSSYCQSRTNHQAKCRDCFVPFVNLGRKFEQDARGPAGYFPPQISSKKTTGQQICSLLILFNIPIYEVCRKFDKNCIKNFENWKILGFLSFSVSI